MASQDTLALFKKYSESLIEFCKNNPKVIGLVLVGSTTETDRVDEWSEYPESEIQSAKEVLSLTS